MGRPERPAVSGEDPWHQGDRLAYERLRIPDSSHSGRPRKACVRIVRMLTTSQLAEAWAILHRHPLGPEVAGDSIHGSASHDEDRSGTTLRPFRSELPDTRPNPQGVVAPLIAYPTRTDGGRAAARRSATFITIVGLSGPGSAIASDSLLGQVTKTPPW